MEVRPHGEGDPERIHPGNGTRPAARVSPRCSGRSPAGLASRRIVVSSWPLGLIGAGGVQQTMPAWFSARTGSIRLGRSRYLAVSVIALLAPLLVMPARASAVSEMAVPFHGTEGTLAGGPHHSVWFTSLISTDAPVEVAPDTTMEGTTNETF